MPERFDVDRFLAELRASPEYAGQIVCTREMPAREAEYAEPREPLPEPLLAMLRARGTERLYTHQARALDLARAGENVIIASGTASGKSLCYTLPIVESLLEDPRHAALLLFPTKALTQDQYRNMRGSLDAAGLGHVVAGVHDGDTTPGVRRKLRDEGAVVLSNPDMMHAGVLSNHARWAAFFERLRWLVIDELHVYNGMFGSGVANLMRRLFRVCEHFGSSPQVLSCSATIGNPRELAESVIGRPFALVDEDGSPRGRRVFVFWNPPRVRDSQTRSRRSANVEAHELMARLIQRGAPTIAFSKAKMTAEMIHRYVVETLRRDAPQLADKVTPYRGGYLAEERREIERRLFDGELLGVSTTAALELGIDVGGLDACVIVGYPGTIASFLQQAGRAGRRDRDSLVFLVGLDTGVNQYVMGHPEYLFDRPVERAVVDPDNPFVAMGHLRCAAREIPLTDTESATFGPRADLVMRVLADNRKLARRGSRWFHSAPETPHHEVSLRDIADKNVVIKDSRTGETLGDVSKFDAQPLLHPEAIYIHKGDTYIVRDLDLERYIATVERVDVDYYTQPLGGTDIHHIDHRMREKEFGTGVASWGEATAYFRNAAYEKIHFYDLDAISVHDLDLPNWQVKTMALWVTPPEDLMRDIYKAGHNAHNGLRGVGYATRNLLPMFLTCQTLDFSHTVGSANSPWHTVFVYERYPLGLGFTREAYDMLHLILPAVRDHIRACDCKDGCPCCTGKPLRGFTTWNVERGEAAIPSKKAALLVLDGLLGDGSNLENPDRHSVVGTDAAAEAELEAALRRRLERMREPEVFHRVTPAEELRTGPPDWEAPAKLPDPDIARREERKREFDREERRQAAESAVQRVRRAKREAREPEEE